MSELFLVQCLFVLLKIMFGNSMPFWLVFAPSLLTLAGLVLFAVVVLILGLVALS